MKGKRMKGFAVCLLLLICAISVPSYAAGKSKISKTKANICIGETVTLKVSDTKGKVTWKSSDKKVASVSKKGVVTAKKEGSCKITANVAGKKYSCNVKVTSLPDNYATLNGKKVKVGSVVKFQYILKSSKPIAQVSIRYVFDHDSLKITNLEAANRYPTWLCNEYIPEYWDGNQVCDITHLVGVDKNNPYDFANIACSKGKVLENLKVKVLKSGNFTMDVDVYSACNKEGTQIKNIKVTEKIK